jgi:two-component system chemotaxis response regulator CheY
MARMLIVDDSIMMRKTLRTILQRAGHTIAAEAANGEQAIMYYSNHRPDLVTLDITMPGMSGLEVIKRIRNFDPDANIVIVSALGQKQTIFEALQNGARNYILKPITEEKLLSVVNMVLGHSHDSSTPA